MGTYHLQMGFNGILVGYWLTPSVVKFLMGFPRSWFVIIPNIKRMIYDSTT